METRSNSTRAKLGGGGSLQMARESQGQRRGQSQLMAAAMVTEAGNGSQHRKVLLPLVVSTRRECCKSVKSIWKSFYICMCVCV